MLKESFDTLYQDGAENGRLLTLNFHPWLMGQPFRSRYLHDAIGYIMRQQGVWAATGAAIIEWYRQHPPGD
jgi:allantoinase